MADAILAQCGIYAIRNTINGKRYVGQSVDIESRKRGHLRSLRIGSHHCIALQRAFDKYGKDSFKHEVIEYCTPAILTEREQYWMDHFSSAGIYNTALAAGSPLGIKRSAASRAKMSVARTGRKLSDETRHKMRESQLRARDLKCAKALEQWSRPGAREAASVARKGRKTSEATKAIIQTQSAQRWADPEYKARVSASSRAAQIKVAQGAADRMRAKWADPEFRNAMIQARQEARKKRNVSE